MAKLWAKFFAVSIAALLFTSCGSGGSTSTPPTIGAPTTSQAAPSTTTSDQSTPETLPAPQSERPATSPTTQSAIAAQDSQARQAAIDAANRAGAELQASIDAENARAKAEHDAFMARYNAERCASAQRVYDANKAMWDREENSMWSSPESRATIAQARARDLALLNQECTPL
jgi:hypothetical protein